MIGSRGVVDAYSQSPAPATVAPGSLIWIAGFNLGMTGDTKVLINGIEAKVLSANGVRIVAQVPLAAAPGIAEVVVARGDAKSKPARLAIAATSPALRSAADTGFGEAAASIAGETAILTAGGFGKEGPPAGAVTVHVDGMPAVASVAARDGSPGEYEVTVGLPSGWKAGDVISLRAGSQAANRTTIRSAAKPEVSFVKLPAGAADLTSLTTADLRGSYVVGSSARDGSGCAPSYLFDLAKASALKLEACLAGGSQGVGIGGQGVLPVGGGAASVADSLPVMTAETEGSGLAALVGPAESPDGVSSKVLLLHPERNAPLTVQLPSAASSLSSFGGGGITATLAGEPRKVVAIDTRTGEVSEPAGGMPGLAAGAGFPGIAGFGQNLDLGDGLNQILSAFVAAPDGRMAVVVGDSADQPAGMKLAVVSGQGQVSARSFPDGWLALLAPAAGAPVPGAISGAPAGVLPRRVSLAAHPVNGAFYVLAKSTGDSSQGFIVFPKEDAAARAVAFPSGWYAATCLASVPLYSFQLSSLVAVPASQNLETAVKSPCLAAGMLVADPAAGQADSVAFPAQSALNLSGSAGTMNEFVYGGNSATPDSLAVFDGAADSTSQIPLPSGAVTYSGLTQIEAMNSLIGVATRSSQGDAGFVLFNLESGESRGLPLPNGFSSAASVGVFPVTRKMVAVGTRGDGAGSQLVVYDLITGEPAVVPNPPGVAWIGSTATQAAAAGTGTGAGSGGGFPGGTPPGGGAGPGGGIAPGSGAGPGSGVASGGLPAGTQRAGAGLVRANTKSNTVAAVCFDADKKQAGVLALRVH